MVVLRGRFRTSSAEASYEHHRVYLVFNRPAKEIVGVNGSVPSVLSTTVEPDGSFSLEVSGKVTPPVTLELRAPDGAVLYRRHFSGIDELRDLEALVDPAIPPSTQPHPDRYRGLRAKLKGRVIAQEGAFNTCGLQVLIWARADGEETYRVVFSAVTTEGGYFTGEAPRERYEEAYAQVAEVPKHTVPLRLEDGFLPERVIVVIPITEAEYDLQKRKNGCTSEVRTVLDPEDLAEPLPSLSQDPGKCVDFTVPNRVIEEFSFYKVVRTTDPEIKGSSLPPDLSTPKPVVGYMLDLISKGEIMRSPTVGENVRYERVVTPATPNISGEESFTRQPFGDIKMLEKMDLNVDSSFISELLADPDMFTPEELMTAARRKAIVKLKELYDIFKKKSPSRGELTADNPVDWDETPTFYQATTIAHGHILHFKQVWRADGYSLGDLLYSLPLAPCQKKTIAIVDWERREMTARTELETAEERLLASLNRDRDISEMVQVSVSEQMRAGSRSEVASWAAGGGLGFGIDGFFIGAGGGGGGSYASSSAWQDAARRLSSSTLQQLRDSIVQAATAVRNRRSTVVQTVRQGETVQVQTEVVANHNHCHAITIQYFEVLRHFLITHELVGVQECLFIPLRMTPFDHDKILRWKKPLRRFLKDRSLARAFDAVERIRTSYVDTDLPTGSYAEEEIEHLDGELFIEFVIARPRDKEEDESFSEYLERAWSWWFLGGNVEDVYRRYMEVQTEKDRVFREQIAPRVAEEFVKDLKIRLVLSDGGEREVDLDPTLVSDYVEGVPLYVRLNSTGSLPRVKREDIKGIRIETEHKLPPGSKVVVRSAFFRYRTKHLNHHLYRNRRVNDDLIRIGSGASAYVDKVYLSTPLDRVELRNPRKEDRELARRLVKHLNHNIEYYHRVIWLSMDPNRRYMLLDGFIAPNSGGRSVASVVENRVVAIVGNCLVMPVAPGFKLDPTYKEDAGELFDVYAPLTPIPPVRVAVPTRGVFAESVMGSCNSCEEKDESRFWRWEESPCPDKPPPIGEVSTESRRAQPPDMKTQGFPPPIIAMQNAPAAPDPTSLATLLQAFLKPDVFRDITGLAGTQRNALEALQKAFGMAQALGSQALGGAAKLATLDKVARTIRAAKAEGLINSEQAGNLLRSAIRSAIDGGDGDPDEVISSIRQAVDSGLIEPEQGRQLAADAIRRMIHGERTPPAEPASTEEVTDLARTASRERTRIRVERPGGERLSVEPALTADDGPRRTEKLCGLLTEKETLLPTTVVGQIIASVAETEELPRWRVNGGVLLENGRVPGQEGTTRQNISRALGNLYRYIRSLYDKNPHRVIQHWKKADRADLGLEPSDFLRELPAFTSGMIETVRRAAGMVDPPFAWSACFISYCVRRAQIILGIEDPDRNKNEPDRRYYLLRLSASHTTYVEDAVSRRLRGRPGYVAYLPVEDGLTIEPGDITVVAYINGDVLDDINDIYSQREVDDSSLQQLMERAKQIMELTEIHCDIVVGTEQEGDVWYARAVGGNLWNSVRYRRFRITPVEPDRGVFRFENDTYEQEDDNGQLVRISGSGSTGGRGKSAEGRVLLVLKLAEECRTLTDDD